MQTFNIKKGDTLPAFAVIMTYANGIPIDLTLGSVFLCVGSLTNFAPVFSGACVITDAVNGKAEYRWTGSDISGTGLWWAEFKSFWTGSEITLPNDNSLMLKIFPEYE